MTPLLSWALLVVIIASGLVAAISGFATLGHINRNKALVEVLILGVWAPREFFTDVGWRHRQRSVRATAVGFGAFTVWALMKVFST